jgi:predicted flap endonuclease-1-like 5' DNA nuclease
MGQMTVYKVEQLRGATPWLSAMLRGSSIEDSDELLAACGPTAGRAALAEELGVEERRLLELCNRADLVRIRGVGRVYSDLLEFAGVDTVMELAQRNPDNLFAKMEELAGQHSVRRLPRREDVHSWVAQAKTMDRKVFY